MAPPTSRSSAGGTGVGAGGWSDAPLARALFAYLSSGENQLSFLEGDLIALMGKSDLAMSIDMVHMVSRNCGTYRIAAVERNEQSAGGVRWWVNDRASNSINMFLNFFGISKEIYYNT